MHWESSKDDKGIVSCRDIKGIVCKSSQNLAFACRDNLPKVRRFTNANGLKVNGLQIAFVDLEEWCLHNWNTPNTIMQESSRISAFSFMAVILAKSIGLLSAGAQIIEFPEIVSFRPSCW
jgi:hypothetical protein